MKVIVVDVRNGKVHADGSNIDLPPEGQESFLRSLVAADVVVEIHADNMIVTKGYDKRIVLLGRTKSALQLSAEKAAKDLDNRTDNQRDDLEIGEHPVEQKFRRVWDGSVESGTPETRGLKGY
jgi:hypothetical protein